MTETTLIALEWVSYLTVLIIAIIVSWKKGEKEGSVFMLKYLREGKFFNDTDYNRFMQHIRSEKALDKVDEISPKELKKNDKEDEEKL